MVLLALACGDGGTSSTTPVTQAPVVQSIVAVAGANGAGPVAAALPDSVAVRVVDQFGASMAGVSVQFTVAEGTVSPAASVTNATGIARTLWTLGSHAGTQTLEARAGGATVTPLRVSATARPAAPNQLGKASGDHVTLSQGGQAPLVTLVTDQFSNPIANTDVLWQVALGGGSVTPATSTTDSTGRAKATWTLSAIGENRVVAAVAGIGSVTFVATATPSTQPVSSIVIAALPAIQVGGTVALAVTLRDAASYTLGARVMSFTSSNTSVATVDAAGVVHAVSAGQATITATSEGKSAQVSVTITPAPVTETTPPAPSNLTATMVSSAEISIAWQDNSVSEDAFQVEVQTYFAGWALVATLPAGSVGFRHTSLFPSTAYQYRVRACRTSVCSPFSNMAFTTTGTTPSPTGSLPTVTTAIASNVTLTGASMQARVLPNGLPTTLWLEYGTSPLLVGATSTPVKDAGSGTSVFWDVEVLTTLAPQTTYYYRGVAQSSAGVSRGNIVTFRTAAPNAPTELALSMDRAAMAVSMNWLHDGSTEVTRLFLTRRMAGNSTIEPLGEPVFNGEFPATVRSYVDDRIPIDATRNYLYMVKACNNIGCTASAETPITVLPLTAPTNVTATTEATYGYVTLRWTDNTSIETGFQVYRRTATTTDSLTTSSNNTVVTDMGTTKGVTYHYRIAPYIQIFGLRPSKRVGEPSTEVTIVSGQP